VTSLGSHEKQISSPPSSDDFASELGRASIGLLINQILILYQQNVKAKILRDCHLGACDFK
jgi:hypothetical protein